MVRVLDIEIAHVLDSFWRGYYICHKCVWHCPCFEIFSYWLRRHYYSHQTAHFLHHMRMLSGKFPPHHNCHRSDVNDIYILFGIQITSRSPVHDFPSPNYPFNVRLVGVETSKLMINKQRFLTPGHQGWNDLHSLCRIGMECYLLNNDDNNIIYWIMMIIMIMMMMIIIMIIMMTMMIIGTATIMIMIIIITTTLTMTIMKMIMIKTAQTPCQSLYKDRRI